ncbi:ROK family protein [Lacticaseibacillus sp. GG6-2]
MAYLAIDIGGTTTKYGLVDQLGHLSHQSSQPTVKTDEDSFFSAILALVASFPQVTGVGIALPGIIDAKNGKVTACATLPFLEHRSVVASLQQHCALPIAVTNDGDAAALAEHWQGELSGITNGAMVVLGTGIGAALFLDGHLYLGTSEPSFMVLDGIAPATRANTAAPLSAVVTISAMAEVMHITGDDQGQQVFAQLPDAPAAVTDILTAFIQGVAAMIYNMHTLLGLEKVVIGGGISAQPLVIRRLHTAVETYRRVTPLAERTLAPLPITAAHFHNEANLIGAIVPLIARKSSD